MNKDFSELIQFLGDKFDRVDQRFDAVDQRFQEVDQRFDEMKAHFIDLQTSVDGFAHKADTYFQEMVMLSHKVDRHEKWLQQLAAKLGVQLEH